MSATAAAALDRGKKLVGELLYQHDFVFDERVSDTFGDSGRYTRQQSNRYTARIRFVFGT